MIANPCMCSSLAAPPAPAHGAARLTHARARPAYLHGARPDAGTTRYDALIAAPQRGRPRLALSHRARADCSVSLWARRGRSVLRDGPARASRGRGRPRHDCARRSEAGGSMGAHSGRCPGAERASATQQTGSAGSLERAALASTGAVARGDALEEVARSGRAANGHTRPPPNVFPATPNRSGSHTI